MLPAFVAQADRLSSRAWLRLHLGGPRFPPRPPILPLCLGSAVLLLEYAAFNIHGKSSGLSGSLVLHVMPDLGSA
jgi:hypothetical protein